MATGIFIRGHKRRQTTNDFSIFNLFPNRDISGFRMDPSHGTSVLCLDWLDPSETFMPSWSLNNHVPADRYEEPHILTASWIFKIVLKLASWKVIVWRRFPGSYLDFIAGERIKMSLIIHFNYSGNTILMKIPGPEPCSNAFIFML